MYVSPIGFIGRPLPRRWRRQKMSPSSPTTLTLTLIAATYDPGVAITLTFNQAIDISAYNGEAVMVDDGIDTGFVWIAAGAATLQTATTLRVGLVEFEGSAGTVVTLTAPDSTGIVAVSGGGTWAGVTGVALPFG